MLLSAHANSSVVSSPSAKGPHPGVRAAAYCAAAYFRVRAVPQSEPTSVSVELADDGVQFLRAALGLLLVLPGGEQPAPAYPAQLTACQQLVRRVRVHGGLSATFAGLSSAATSH